MRKHLQKIFHFFRVEFEIRRKLPEEWAEFFAKKQHAGGQEIREGRFDFAETLNVRDVTRAFYGEFEIGWSRIMPALEAGRALQGIEGAVDFKRSKFARGEFEFLALRQFCRVEDAAPGRIAPAGNADADLANV